MKNTENLDEVDVQRRYYADTAKEYNDMHVQEGDEHYFAMALLLSMIDYFKFRSILDVGAGTGRTMLFLKEQRPDLIIKGIEPVEELREIGYRDGLSRDDLTDGDATKMQFAAGEFDVVCEFAVLHHIRKPQDAVAEMLRVASKAIFISDSNRFGQGPLSERLIKQFISNIGLWSAFNLLKTKGKGYHISEGDGLFYSYSVFDNYKQIRRSCKSIHVLNTVDGGYNSYRNAEFIALLGLKK